MFCNNIAKGHVMTTGGVEYIPYVCYNKSLQCLQLCITFNCSHLTVLSWSVLMVLSRFRLQLRISVMPVFQKEPTKSFLREQEDTKYEMLL